MDNNIDRISRGLASTTSRRQAFKMLGGGLLGGALAGAGFAVAKDTAAQGGPLGTISAPLSDLSATYNKAAGTIDINGLLDGAAFPTQSLTIDDIAVSEECDVLYLNLLGLEVEINAIPGEGNLLGNLLCAVAGLLDQGGPLQGITGLLNNIFRNLG